MMLKISKPHIYQYKFNEKNNNEVYFLKTINNVNNSRYYTLGHIYI